MKTTKKILEIIFFMVISLLFLFTCTKKETSMNKNKNKLVINNSKIWTGNIEQQWAEALAIENNKITAVGTNEEISKLIDQGTQVIDGEGKFVAPGFIDSHVHYLTGGFQLSSVQLRDAQTPKEFIQRIKDFAETIEPGTWITGGNWDHTNWGGEMPACEWIDSVTQKNPVWVNRLDGHMSLANSLAMKSANVTKDIQDIKGGTIVRTADGFPTGVFKDNAMFAIDAVVPEPSDQMKERALEAAMNYVAQQGVTSVHHMGTWDDLAVFERANNKGMLKTRISAAVPLSTWSKLKTNIDNEGAGDLWLRIGGLKGFADGSLGSHTAAFFAPFTDAPNNTGLLVNSKEDLFLWIKDGDKAGMQAIIHAIGDRANNIVLNLYEQVIRENGERDRRFRIEHAQHLSPADIPRFHQLNVIASMQPYHAIDDGRWAEKVIGPQRIKTTYTFRTLLDTGAKLSFGSDWYVAPPIPLAGIYAAVTRRTLDDKNPDGWVPEQKITVEEALRAYTIDAAFASFEEDIKGSLVPGKLADIVILNQDITQISPEQIRDVKVIKTIVGGKIIFERKN